MHSSPLVGRSVGELTLARSTSRDASYVPRHLFPFAMEGLMKTGAGDLRSNAGLR